MGGIDVKYEVLNQRTTPAFYASSLANRPSFGFVGRIFIDSDSPSTGIYRDTGSAWIQIADSGAGTIGTLETVTTNGNTSTKGISVTANGIGIGTTIPASNRLDIHAASGIQATFNGTGTTNAALQLQSAGVGKWNVRNNYNAEANDFGVFDVLSGIDRIKITNAGVFNFTGQANFSSRLNVNGATDNASYALNVTGAGNFSGAITGSNFTTSLTNQVFTASTSGTSAMYTVYTNAGNSMYVGLNNSTGGTFNAGVYAMLTYGTGNYPYELYTNSLLRLQVSGAGITNVLSRLNVNGATDNASYALNVAGRIQSSTIISAVSDIESRGIIYAAEAGTGTRNIGMSYNTSLDRGVISAQNLLGGNDIQIGKAGYASSLYNIGYLYSDRYIIQPNGSTTLFNFVNANASFTGSYLMQAGGGSSGYGGGLTVFGHSHATKAGSVIAGISTGSGGKFIVNSFGTGDGVDLFTVTESGITNALGRLNVNGATDNATYALSVTGNAQISNRCNIGGAADNSLFSLNNGGGTTYTNGFSPNATNYTGSITLGGGTTYVNLTVGAVTWTLPTPNGNNQMYFIKNAGTGILTLNAFAANQIIDLTNTAVSSVAIAVGGTLIIQQDGNNKSYIIK